ncbi:TrkH family potassium uptake protein [Fervidobacterium thailandense]|uniref:Potassium transporter n=1 Tax=Fervidobacterium thailandense TaxID=1008305 RepID=A0A1E3G539_9BACT|nr:TrkH family potassium uptake protein [Fervidobacterium thailandense]ODN31349.1 potassium transporter [Fervidobacterium thailandense]
MLRRYLKIYKAFSILALQFSAIALFPVVLCFFYPEEVTNVYGFVLTASICVILYALGRLVREEDIGTINYKDGAVLTVFSWLLIAFLASIPHLTVGGLTFSQAIFESVSGLTTTGLTMYSDVTKVSRLILFWRSLTQYVGGAGFALLMLAMVIGPKGLGFYKAEGRMDNLVPNIRRSAQIIILIYFAYTLAGTIALRLVGLSMFDALNHTMTALATGGFSTRNGSVGEFNNLAAEIVIIVLMFLGATGFGVHYAFWKGNWRAVLRNGEPWLMVVSITVGSVVLSLYGTGRYFKNLGSAFRHVTFQLVSAITGTGFQTLPLNEKRWLSFSPFIFLLIVFMIEGGGMDSTSGGVKQFRLWVIVNAIRDAIKNFLLPRGAIRKIILFKGEQQMEFSVENVREALLVLSLYILTFIIGSTILMLHGYDMVSSMFEFASAMDGVGLSAGVTSPNMPLTAMWTLTLGMFTGRFEFLIIIYCVAKLVEDIKLVGKSTTRKNRAAPRKD